MFSHTTQIRVRYAETDQMGYVYYGNYAAYLEVARVEAFRSLGLSYKKMEETGIMMPVLEYKNKFIAACKYDELISIHTTIKEMPGVRINFYYEVFNEENKLCSVAETTLVFVSAETMKPCLPPQAFNDALKPYFA
jgi:acyl-CoA thioester hydrolase